MHPDTRPDEAVGPDVEIGQPTPRVPREERPPVGPDLEVRDESTPAGPEPDEQFVGDDTIGLGQVDEQGQTGES